MGFDWEEILDTDGEGIEDAWSSRVYDAMAYDDYDKYNNFGPDEEYDFDEDEDEDIVNRDPDLREYDLSDEEYIEELDGPRF